MKLQSLFKILLAFFLVIYVVSAAERTGGLDTQSNEDAGSTTEQPTTSQGSTPVETEGDEENEHDTAAVTDINTSKLDCTRIADPTYPEGDSGSAFDVEETSSMETLDEDMHLGEPSDGTEVTTMTTRHSDDSVSSEDAPGSDGSAAEMAEHAKDEEGEAGIGDASEGDGITIETTSHTKVGDEAPYAVGPQEEDSMEISGQTEEGGSDEASLEESPETSQETRTTEISKHVEGDDNTPLDEAQDDASTTVGVSGDEAGSDEQASETGEKSDETKESLIMYDYEVPLRLACETKKLICHNVSSSNAITIQGSRKGSALFASFDASEIRNSGLSSGDVVSAKLVLNKIGGSRTLPVRVDILNLESKSSRISKSTVLATYQVILPKTQNSPVSVDITPAVHKLLENAKDQDNFTVLVSAYSRTRFGDILTFPTKDYPNGLSLKLKVTKLPEDSSSSEQPKYEKSTKEIQSLKERIFSGNNLYVAVGILATVVIIVTVLMIM